jgi:hypothetical protein
MDKRSWLDLYGTRYPEFNSHPQYLAAQIERAFNVILAYAFRNDYSNFDLYTKGYPDVEVSQDAYGTWHAEMPLNDVGGRIRIVQLPDAAEGVRRITAIKDQKTVVFVPIPKDAWSTFFLLEVNKVSKYTPYSITNNRVEFAKEPPVPTVTLDIVRAFMDYGDNEDIPVPAGHEQEFEQLIASFIQGTPPPNKLNA